MNLQLQNSQRMIDEIINFLQQVYAGAQKKVGIIAVSGGIDSALSLTLLTRALGTENVLPIMLPYGKQDLGDGEVVLKFNKILQENWQVVDIKSVVDVMAQTAGVGLKDKIRFGNLMARTRMMLIYDLAKKHDGLVCGTENKSEKYLGYFTRFGDEASDVEPFVHLYKTQVFQLAKFLNLPKSIIQKAPTAGLWEGQTDERELGFSYEVADQVLWQMMEEKKKIGEISISGVEGKLERELIEKVVRRVRQMEFKQQVPYVVR